MSKTDEETTTRYDTVADRKVNHEGRIGYTWRLFPNEAEALDAAIAKAGYSDRTSWFREVVLKLPPLERKSAAKADKPKKGGKKAAAKKGGKKTAAKAPKGPRKSKADIGPAAE